MNYKKIENEIKKKEKINNIIFIVVSIAFASLTLFFFFSSKREYTINLIINIILTILYGSYFIFNFSCVVQIYKSYNRLFNELNNTVNKKSIYKFIKESTITIDNINFYSYLVKDNTSTEIELLSLEKLDLYNNIELTTKSRYIVEANHA